MTRIAGLFYKQPLNNIPELLENMGQVFLSNKGGYISSRVTTSLRTKSPKSMVGLVKVEALNGDAKIERSCLGNNQDSIFAVVDGSIHNWQELIDSLGLSGQKQDSFDAACLLIEGYLKEGKKFFRRINGEFAFLLYDRRKDLFYAVSDRFGTHLIFYSQIGNNFIFSSEIKSLFTNSNVGRDPNFETVYRYVFSNYRYAYGTEETFFKNINLMPANTILFIQNAKVNKEALWNFECNDYLKITDNEAAERFHDLLEKSMKLRLDPLKKPSVFLLSGGLDSSTLTALAARRSKKQLVSFSICYEYQNSLRDELYYDERDFIRPTVEMYGIDWRSVFPSSDRFSEIFLEMLKRHDEPMASPTIYSHYFLVKSIADSGYKTIFGGDGGDHALAGLYDDVPYYFADLKKQGDNARLEYELSCWQKLHDHPVFSKNRKIWEIYSQRCFDWANPGRIIDYVWDDERMRDLSNYNLAVNKDFKKYSKPLPLYPSVSRSYLISKLWQDLLYTSSPPVNRGEDINLATFGVSSRPIFLDSEFMKFCWGLPGHLMIRDGLMKFLIRYAMKGKLPESVRMRKEHSGLNAPANLWFRGPLQGLIKEAVDSGVWSKIKIFDQHRLQNIFDEHLACKANHMMFLWKVFSLLKWFEHWGLV